MTNTATATPAETVAYVGRCRTCRKGVRVELPAVEIIREAPAEVIAEANRMQDAGEFDGFAARMEWIRARDVAVEVATSRYASRLGVCSCGNDRVAVALVVHRHTDTTCGARCRNATGPQCDCSCDGENHGAGW